MPEERYSKDAPFSDPVVRCDACGKLILVEKLKKLGTGQIAPMATFLASNAAADVTAQIFAVRGNEIFLMSQSRPIRGMHTAEGWTPETIAERVLPAMKPSFTPLENSSVVFSWDPV